MIELRNKMMLCERDEHARALNRIVIILFENVDVIKNETHVIVTIFNKNKAVDCLRFQINFILKRLRDDESLRSRLYQLYIHALTSDILSDFHTCRTSTEKVLSILRSQSKKISMSLQKKIIYMLKFLSTLTSHRSFYSAHLQIMQQID